MTSRLVVHDANPEGVDEVGPFPVVTQIEVVDDLHFGRSMVEQRDTGRRVVVARRVKNAIEKWRPSRRLHRVDCGGHTLRVVIPATGQLSEVETEMCRHDVRRREVRQLQMIDHPDKTHEPLLDLGQRDRAFFGGSPLVFVENRFHQGRGEVEPQVEHPVVLIRIVIAIGTVTAKIERSSAIACATDVLQQAPFVDYVRRYRFRHADLV